MSINSGVINGPAINGTSGGTISITTTDLRDSPGAIITSDVSLTVIAVNDERDAAPAVITNPEPNYIVWLRGHDIPGAIITSAVSSIVVRSVLRDTAAKITSTGGDVLTAKQTERNTAVIVSAVTGTVYVTEDTRDANAAVIVSAVDIDNASIVVRDAAVITSAMNTLLTTQLTVRDTAVIVSGFPSGASVLIVRDPVPAVGTSTATPVGLRYLTARDDTAAVITSDVVDLASGVLVVRDSFVGFSRALPFSLRRCDVREQAYLASWAYPVGGTYAGGWADSDVWTANVGVWGMSRYADTGITDQGTRYAVSDGGLFEVGDVDENLMLKTGGIDFDTPIKKRVRNVYVMGQHDVPLTVTVTAEVKGTRATHAYTTKADNAAEGTTVRADLGKGFNSSFYQFQIDSTGKANLFGGKAHVNSTRRAI
jgi:hypothetical protein